MVYKNGFKEYLGTFVYCTVVYGVLMGLFNNNMTSGIISGVVFGAIFTLFLAFFAKSTEKKSAKIRAEIAEDRDIICEGPATYQKGAAAGGWLFLSDCALEFFPHKMNIGGTSVLINLGNITKVATGFNRIKIYTEGGNVYSFTVNKAKLWMKAINNML